MSLPLPVIVFEAECRETRIGESVHVLGSIGELGDWQLERSTALVTSQKEFPLWRSRLFQLKSTPPDSIIQFKLLIKNDNDHNKQPDWEPCANRIFRCPMQGQLARVTAVFGKNNQVSVTITEASLATALEAYPDEATRPRILVTSPPRQDASPIFGGGDMGVQRDSMRFEAPKPLRDLIVQQSKKSLPTAALKIIAEHAKSRSLRQKFLLVRDTLTKSTDDETLTADDWVQLLLSIAFCALYVPWVATGTIPCGEDGGHHRPNQAAVAGQEILNFYEGLRYKVARQYVGTHHWEVDMFKYFSSLITPCLPSCASQFTCSVPLTRIRDIAHRNDINEDLKREIKSRLQNKLHRCAGPEDLETCKQFINRFQQNPSAYPGDFIHQFNLFYQELRDFFNAADLTERLQSLQANTSNPRRSNAVSWFLSNKFTFDKSDISEWRPLCDSFIAMMKCTTHLRMAVVDELEADAFRECSNIFFGSDPSHGQSLHIVDVQAEKLFFTLTSRMVNEVEKVASEGFTTLSDETMISLLKYLLSSLVEILKNFACSDYARHYSFILAQEIRQELECGACRDREMFLMHCASIARRVLRLCETFSDFVSATLPPANTAEFAVALGVSEDTGRIYGEGLIRASLPFQASRCASLLLRFSEVEGLGRSSYITICSANGDASGGLAIATDTIEGSDVHAYLSRDDSPHNDEKEVPIILMVKNATGDEELEGLASRLSEKVKKQICLIGILLAHEIPTMSHLGVRARQQGVGFIALSNPLVNWSEVISRFHGKHISLSSGEPQMASPNKCGVAPVSRSELSRPKQNLADDDGGDGDMEGDGDTRLVRCGSEITEAECGSKAAQCQRLCEQAAELGISAPKSIALTRRAFPMALRWPENDTLRGRIELCIRQLQEKTLLTDKEETLCDELIGLIKSLKSNQSCLRDLANKVWSCLVEDETSIGQMVLMVRSSSNAEDLEGLSAAGLYDSFSAHMSWELQNVHFDRVWDMIKSVWASLYTARAVKARRAAGVEGRVWMGVLMQPLIPATWSFVAHTQCPHGMGGTSNEIYAELAQGLGEVLAGGGAQLGGGRPTRILVNKETTQVSVLSLSDFSARYESQTETGDCIKVYTALKLRDFTHTFWQRIGTKLHTLMQLENICNQPQDVEGCFVLEPGTEVDVMHIVQTRPQP